MGLGEAVFVEVVLDVDTGMAFGSGFFAFELALGLVGDLLDVGELTAPPFGLCGLTVFSVFAGFTVLLDGMLRTSV